MSAGEYFAGFFRAAQSGDIEEFVRSLPFDRAQQLTTDNAGILPEPIVGNVIKFADSSRPVFGSFTSRPMPLAGKKFERPRVTQRVQVGEQTTEGAAVSSRKMLLTSDEVVKRTFAGSLDISEQDMDWTDPAILQIVLEDFAQFYSEVTEAAACDVLEALIDDNTSVYDATDVGSLVESYVDGVVAVYNSSKRMPDTVWHDLASWATLTSTTNTNNDRTALSMIREALGEMGVSMRWVVGPQLAADTRIIGVSGLIEGYEQRKGLLRATNATVLTETIAYRGYVAFHGRAEGFVGLEAA
jgi:hypothetical protein